MRTAARLFVTAVAAIGAVASTALLAQSSPAPGAPAAGAATDKPGPTPRLHNGKPDLSGHMDTLKVGDTITVSGLRAKNEASMNIGQAKITTADGKRVFDGNAPGHDAAP